MSLEYKTLRLISMLLCLAVLTCGEDPASYTKPHYTSTLTIIVKDSAGVPINGAQVITYPATIKQVTDQNGVAVFENIERQQYQIVVSRADIPVFYQDVYIGKRPLTIQFIIALEVTINLVVKYISGEPLDGTEIYTSPPTSTVTTDEFGYAVLENVPVKPYTFIIKRDQAIAYIPNQMISIRNGVIQDLELIVNSQKPRVFITEPHANYYHSIFNITFKAEGKDFEDGILPSRRFTWYSNIDGEIGTGSEITVDRLSVGHHYITVYVVDSDGNGNDRTISITLFFFAKDSYFPIPPLGLWDYSNAPTSFTVTNTDGATDTYILYDIRANMVEVNARQCSMPFRVVSTNEQPRWYRYTVVDYYDNDDDEFFVTKTIEHLEFWKRDAVSQDPFSKVTIETTYDVKFPLFHNHFDISQGNDFTFDTMASVAWLFEGVSYGSQRFQERIDVNSETSFEGYETVETPLGVFNASKLKITQGEAERIWWLTEGYGIVQYTYNTFGRQVIATLSESTLGDIQYDKSGLSSSTPKIAHTGEAPVLKTFSETEPPQELRDLVRISRSMAPR